MKPSDRRETLRLALDLTRGLSKTPIETTPRLPLDLQGGRMLDLPLIETARQRHHLAPQSGVLLDQLRTSVAQLRLEAFDPAPRAFHGCQHFGRPSAAHEMAREEARRCN